MSINKIIGWVLLVVGLAVIGYSIYSSHAIFTAKKPAPEIFQANSIASQPSSAGQIKSIEDMQKEMQNMIGQQIQQILPVNALSDMLNLAAWSVFAGILIFSGSKISGIGISLLRKT